MISGTIRKSAKSFERLWSKTVLGTKQPARASGVELWSGGQVIPWGRCRTFVNASLALSGLRLPL